MTLTADNWYSRDDSMAVAWRKYHRARPDVLTTWREQDGRWPLGHPNEDIEAESHDARRAPHNPVPSMTCDACLTAGICRCGNRFDGDNLCMLSACEQEE